jgi:3-hydroxybutyrate dehydrogenase
MKTKTPNTASAIQGKAAIITGSTSGIGLAIARSLAQAGVNIMLNGFGDAAAIEQERAGLAAETGVKVLYNGADVSKAEQVSAMIDATYAAFGSVDILVNNAGIQFVSPVENFPLEKWDAVLATNLSAAFFGITKALPLMRHNGWGRIINIASAHGLVASAHKSAYVAAKHGVVGLTKSIALETAGQMITCNAICPGWVLTPLVQKQIDAIAAADKTDTATATIKLLSDKQPSQQFVRAEDIGAMVVFLCSAAGAQITGTALSMDGGWTAQ